MYWHVVGVDTGLVAGDRKEVHEVKGVKVQVFINYYENKTIKLRK
jgi:hypothetical protein